MKSAPALLHLDASPRSDRSRSRQLGQAYLAAWHAAHPAGHLVRRDLAALPPPFVTEPWVEGAFAPADSHSPAAQAARAVSDQFVDELLAADQLVITTPIYNLTVPAALKAWIDQIVRIGRTFAIGPDGFAGLVGDKPTVVLVSSGSDFRPGTPGGAYNFLEPYLRAILGFVGISRVRFVYAHSQNQADTVGAEALRAALVEAQQLGGAPAV